MNIEGRPATLTEVVLDRSSQINAYIKEHPDQAEAVDMVMAMAQGPKGLILLAVNSVVSQTVYAEKVKEAVDIAGQYVAEKLQNVDHLDANDEYGNYLIGGGTLIATTLLGIGGKGVGAAAGAGKKIIFNKEDVGGSHGAITDSEAGLRPLHPIKETPYANWSVGFAPGTGISALDGMRGGGGHAIRHLEGDIIPNKGSLTSRLEAFKEVAVPILEAPKKSADWRVGGTEGRAFLGEVSGKPVVIVVAKDGPFAGKVVSAFVPDSNQLSIIMSR